MTSSSRPEEKARKPVRVVRKRPARIRTSADPARPRIGIPSPPGGLWKNPVLRMGLLSFGLLVVVALIVDIGMKLRQGALAVPRPVPAGPESLVLGIRDREYSDPAGRFSLRVPAAWHVVYGQAAGSYDVVFRGPLDLECMVRVTPLPHERFDRLLSDIYAIEERWGVNMNIRAHTHEDRPIVERRVRLIEQQVLALDFLEGNIGHHIQFGAPRGEFERFEPLFRDIFETYQPRLPDANMPTG